MKPRVFVSSTYYDLKYVRENLEHFLKFYGFEPVLFENGSVAFRPGKAPDASCYLEVEQCHMMILIIGGRYGSLASPKERQKEIERYEKEEVSVTRREFEKALQRGIPVFVFIDKNVHAGYRTYRENQKLIDEHKEEFKPSHVDDMRVYKFVDAVQGMTIKTFERIEEIEEYLRQQLAGMFYEHLVRLHGDSETKKVLSAVDELKILSQQMGAMLQQVGEKVIEKPELEKVRDEQKRLLIDGYTAQVPTKWLKLQFLGNLKRVNEKVTREVVIALKESLSQYVEKAGKEESIVSADFPHLLGLLLR